MKSIAEFFEREGGHILTCLFLLSGLFFLRHCCPDPFIERTIDLFCGALIGAMRGAKKLESPKTDLPTEPKTETSNQNENKT